jgi:hypothetical protein
VSRYSRMRAGWAFQRDGRRDPVAVRNRDDPVKQRHLCATAVALVTLLPASAGAAGLPTLLTQIGLGSTFAARPAQVIYTGDGSGVLGGFSGKGPLPRFGRLNWSLWNHRRAAGSGAVWLDDCTPNCADGTFHPYAVRVSAFDPEAGHFTHLILRYMYDGKKIMDSRRMMKYGRNYVW